MEVLWNSFPGPAEEGVLLMRNVAAHLREFGDRELTLALRLGERRRRWEMPFR